MPDGPSQIPLSGIFQRRRRRRTHLINLDRSFNPCVSLRPCRYSALGCCRGGTWGALCGGVRAVRVLWRPTRIGKRSLRVPQTSPKRSGVVFSLSGLLLWDNSAP